MRFETTLATFVRGTATLESKHAMSFRIGQLPSLYFKFARTGFVRLPYDSYEWGDLELYRQNGEPLGSAKSIVHHSWGTDVRKCG